MVSPLKKGVSLLFTKLISRHDNFVILRIKKTWKHRLQDGNLIGKDCVPHLVGQVQLILIKDRLIIQKLRNRLQLWKIGSIFLFFQTKDKALQETISLTKRDMDSHTYGNLTLH